MTENVGSFKIPKKKRIRLITPRYIYVKFTLIYTLFYVLAFALGCLLFHLTDGRESALFNRRITDYFSASLDGCGDAFAFSKRLLSVSMQDVTRLALIFTAGFTVFVSLAVTGLLIFRGLSFGFSVSYLAYAIRAESVVLARPVASLTFFSLLGAMTAAVMIHLAVKTTMFSDEFKALCGRPRLILHSRALYMQMLRFLVALGAILFINLIRCVI